MPRKRFISSLVCICLIGITMVPSAYLPCCCNSRHALGESPMHVGCCAEHAPVMPCCAKPHIVKCCSPTSTIKAPCPVCRCIEQMQIVAISEAESSLQHARLAAVLYTLPVDSSLRPPVDEARDAAPERFPSGIVVLLQTCVFLC